METTKTTAKTSRVGADAQTPTLSVLLSRPGPGAEEDEMRQPIPREKKLYQVVFRRRDGFKNRSFWLEYSNKETEAGASKEAWKLMRADSLNYPEIGKVSSWKVVEINLL
ncbi:MAG: hypothetical protein U1E51_30600 [Candidatus Binatia bacterium]|nr:hypothetical protein [Candidatus Binatia bacterium]